MIEYSMYKENVLTGEMTLNNKNESLLCFSFVSPSNKIVNQMQTKNWFIINKKDSHHAFIKDILDN